MRRSRLRSLWVLAGGCRVHALVPDGCMDPRRASVVLLHGLGVSGSYFVPTAELLSGEFAIYVPDLPGHGKSGTPRTPLDVPQLAEALVAWLDTAGLPCVSVVANSMGCQTAVEAAVRYPERFDRLVLVGPVADPTARNVRRHLGRLLLGGLYERLSLVWLLLKDYLRMGYRFYPELRAMLRYRIEDRLPLVMAPVLVIRGENDPIAPRSWHEKLARSANAGPVVVLPRWGHALNYSAPRQLAEAVTPFLRGGTLVTPTR